jgi:hypothetical protein
MTIDHVIGKLKMEYALPYKKAFARDYNTIEYKAAIGNMILTKKTEFHPRLGFHVMRR